MAWYSFETVGQEVMKYIICAGVFFGLGYVSSCSKKPEVQQYQQAPRYITLDDLLQREK